MIAIPIEAAISALTQAVDALEALVDQLERGTGPEDETALALRLQEQRLRAERQILRQLAE